MVMREVWDYVAGSQGSICLDVIVVGLKDRERIPSGAVEDCGMQAHNVHLRRINK
jgi:hypothetical protein